MNTKDFNTHFIANKLLFAKLDRYKIKSFFPLTLTVCRKHLASLRLKKMNFAISYRKKRAIQLQCVFGETQHYLCTRNDRSFVLNVFKIELETFSLHIMIIMTLILVKNSKYSTHHCIFEKQILIANERIFYILRYWTAKARYKAKHKKKKQKIPLLDCQRQIENKAYKTKTIGPSVFTLIFFSGCQFVRIFRCSLISHELLNKNYIHITRTNSTRRLKLCASFVVSTYIFFV